MTREAFMVNVSEGPGNCWTWTGRIGNDGYGRVGEKLAHRVAYELFVGAIPKGAQLHHRCMRRTCVNPHACLVPMTRSQHVATTHRERTGQMAWGSLRVARHFHDQVTERMRQLTQDLRDQTSIDPASYDQ